ncbi:hypothetical protein CDD83_2994 [Cordyceps sp. RAO-2017]|nr:hypothetical protein CDD83_2994 [Cordyceps sp. RAO-2017]
MVRIAAAVLLAFAATGMCHAGHNNAAGARGAAAAAAGPGLRNPAAAGFGQRGGIPRVPRSFDDADIEKRQDAAGKSEADI